jgi:hypothetical protein
MVDELKNPDIDLLKRGMQQENEWGAANRKTAIESLTEFLIGLIRPFVKKAVSFLFDWISKLFK